MKLKRFALHVVLFALVSLPLAVHAQKNGAPKAGAYKDWHDVDEVTIVQPFQLANYRQVVVQPLNTQAAPLPEASDNSFKEVKAALGTSTEQFVTGLRAKLKSLPVQTGKTGGAKTLIVRAKIMKSDPGSQAARYFAGFGAGAAKVAVSGEIVDGGTNKVLVRFAQERRSGVGMFGGGYRDLLHRSIRQIGGDVAEMLRAF